MRSCDVEKKKKKRALQILSVDSSHTTVSQISSCNGTRRTAVHVHPRSSDLKPFILLKMPLRIAIIVKFCGYTWWRVSCPSTFLSLLPLCCFPPQLGSQQGVSGEQLRPCFAVGVVALSFHTRCAPLLRQFLSLLIRFWHKSNPKTGVF